MSHALKKSSVEKTPSKITEQIYQALFEQAADGIFIADSQGRYLEVNPRGCEMLGYTREELLNFSITDLIPAEEVTTNPLRLDEMQAGKPVLKERRLRTKEGRLLSVEISARKLSDNTLLGVVRDVSARKQVEVELQNTHEQLRVFFTQTIDGCFFMMLDEAVCWDETTDKEALLDHIFAHQHITEINEAMLAQYGATREQMLKLTPNDFFQHDLAHGRALWRQLFDVGKLHLERDERKMDGTPMWIQGEYILLYDSAGRITGHFGIQRDITARKQLEEENHKREREYRALVENSPDFIARYDREFRRTYVNPAIQKLFGKPAENVLHKVPDHQSPVYAPQIYIDQLRQVIETATECVIEMPFRTAQGEMHWGHMRFVPEFGADGQVASVLAIGRDIHEIKEKERHFRMLAENFPDFVVRFDRDCRYTYVNAAVEKALGLPAAAFLGKTLQELPQRQKPEQTDTLLALIRRAFDEGVTNDTEVYWDTQVGKRIFEIRHVPEKDATGNVVTVLGIAHDITERKQVERERLAHLRFLESLDQVNRAIQGTNDLEQMMRDVLDAVLSVFECDRASLVYPCALEAVTWRAPMERTKPEWPGTFALGVEVPLDPGVVRVFEAVLASDDPVGFGPQNDYPLPTDVAERFDERSRLASQLATAIYPKVDKPYMFVIHQCSYPRVWTLEEKRLFQQIGRRLADGLTGLLAYRDLRESERRYRTLLENSPDVIARFDREGRYLYVNSALEKITGIPVDKFPGKRIGEMLSEHLAPMIPSEVLALRQSIAQIFDTGTTFETETNVALSDGEHIFNNRFIPERDEAGQVTSVLHLVRDITEQKWTEQEAQRSNALLRAIIEAAPTAIIGLDLNGNVQMVWNPAAEKMLGWSAQEVMGRPLPSVPQKNQEEFRRFRELIRRGLTLDGVEVRRQKRDGSFINYSIYASPLRDIEGRITGNIAVLVDITERKRAEEEHQTYLHFLKSLDQINRAIQGTNDLEQMMKDVLDAMLVIFECDRAWLVYPCDPEAATWQVPMERTKPEWPGALPVGVELPLEPAGAEVFRITRQASRPVTFGPDADYPVSEEMTKAFGVQSFIVTAFYPKVGKPWSFGLHQCAYPRVWTPQDQRLFQEIGRRLADGLTGLLAYRNLRESERRLAEAEGMAHVGWWDRDYRANSITLSDEACRIFGLSVEANRYGLARWHERWQELIHPEDRPGAAQAAAAALQGGPRYEVEYRVIQPSGEVRFVQSRGDVTWDESGQPWRMFGIMQDITELRQTERELRASEARFRTFVDHATDGFFLHDAQGTILDVNHQACQSMGYTRQELVGMSPYDFDVDIAPSLLDQFEARLDTGEVMAFDTHHRRKDGSVFPVEIRIRPFWQGKHRFGVSLVRDITERKRIEAELRASETRYRALVESQIDLISRYLPDTTLTFVNDAYCKFYGKKREELLGLSFLTMVAPEFHEAALQETDSLVKEPRSIAGEYLSYTGDGKARWIHWIIQSIVDETGQVSELQAIGRDITPLKRAEAEIRQLNQELEQRVVQRTAQLAEANDELEAFAYSVSHDLRAPLRHIDGFLEMLEKRLGATLDERSRHYMATIADSSKRMTTLIDDLLSFSRMGRYEMSKVQVNLAELTQEVIEELEPETRGRSIRWHVAVLPVVSGDRAMLRVVLVNLIANALKFTQPRSPAEIEIGYLPDQKSELIVFVRDNGVGFDMDYSSKLFGVFQRLHRIEEFDGTGIGLATVRRIIQRHGGRTWAKGQVDQGATFYFSLPQSSQEA